MLASMNENQTSIMDLPLDVFLLLYENNDQIETENICAGCFWQNGLCPNCFYAADGLTIDDEGNDIISVCSMYQPKEQGEKEYREQMEYMKGMRKHGENYYTFAERQRNTKKSHKRKRLFISC